MVTENALLNWDQILTKFCTGKLPIYIPLLLQAMSAMLSNYLLTYYSITPQSEQIATAQSTHWYFKGRLWRRQFLYCLTGETLTCWIEVILLASAMRSVECSLPGRGGCGCMTDRCDALRDMRGCRLSNIFQNSENTFLAICNFFGRVNTVICPF
jgi:hypothetical protein